MARPLLVIVTGPPGAGKTTIGKHIAQHLPLPFIHKDGFKEILFDTLEVNNQSYATMLQKSSYRLLYYVSEKLLEAGQSLVAESNFLAEFDDNQFLALKEKYRPYIVQVLCSAPDEILFDRFKTRAQSGKRHPGHHDHTRFNDFTQSLIERKNYRLTMADETIEFDTRDVTKLDTSTLCDIIRKSYESIELK